jgi:hypothetical protein
MRWVVELEVSSMHVAGIAKAAATLGYDDVVPSLPPAVRAAFETPFSRRWHPAVVLISFSDALVAHHGAQALENHSYEMAKSSFGAALRPLVSVALALMGGSPGALFARVGDGLSLALRGVRVKWRADERTLVLHYPITLPDEAVASWRGVARFLFELANTPGGGIAEHTFSGDRRTLTLKLSWPTDSP